MHCSSVCERLHSTVFLKKNFFLGNSCPLWQALLLGRQFQNSNLKSFFRIVQQYYWEDTISCQPNHILIMLYLWKIQVFYFAFAFRNIFVCVSASSCWYCLLFFNEIWVWGLSNNCGIIIAWISGIVGNSLSESDVFSTSISISASVLSMIVDPFNFYASPIHNNQFFLINPESNITSFPNLTAPSQILAGLHVSFLRLASAY